MRNWCHHVTGQIWVIKVPGTWLHDLKTHHPRFLMDALLGLPAILKFMKEHHRITPGLTHLITSRGWKISLLAGFTAVPNPYISLKHSVFTPIWGPVMFGWCTPGSYTMTPTCHLSWGTHTVHIAILLVILYPKKYISIVNIAILCIYIEHTVDLLMMFQEMWLVPGSTMRPPSISMGVTRPASFSHAPNQQPPLRGRVIHQ